MARLCRCGAVVDVRCERCDSPRHKRHRKTTKQRGYGSDWQRVRARKFARNPLCEQWEVEGKTTATQEVHHIVPISVDPSRRLDVSNLMSLCAACHDAEHSRAARH